MRAKLAKFMIFIGISFFTYSNCFGGAYEQLLQMSGGKLPDVPTPTAVCDTSIAGNCQSGSQIKPSTSSISKPHSSLSPSQSMAVGIFGSLFSGFFDGLFNYNNNAYNAQQEAEQRAKEEYQKQQELLNQQKKQALDKWHKIQQNQTSQSTANNQTSTSLGFKTLGSTLQPFQSSQTSLTTANNQNNTYSGFFNTPQVLPSNLDSSTNAYKNDDFNNIVGDMVSNTSNNALNELGKAYLEKYHDSNLLLAKSKLESQKINKLGKYVSEKTFDNTIGIATIIIDYKNEGLSKAISSGVDFVISLLEIPQTNIALMGARTYSSLVFNALEKDLTSISNAVGMDFNYKEFVDNNLTPMQKSVYEWVRW